MSLKSKLKMTGVAALLALAASASVATVPNARAQAEAAMPLTLQAGDRVLGVVTADQPVRFSLQLPYNDQAGLDVLDQRLFTPGDPLFHKFLSAREFNDRFAPTQEQYNELISLAERNGLSVKETHSGRTLLSVEAPASKVQSLFGLHMNQIQTAEGKVYNAADRGASLPGAFAAMGVSVAGLNQRPQKSHAVIRGPVPSASGRSAGAAGEANPAAGSLSGGYTPTDIRKTYNTTSLTQTGAGQTIALYELSSTNYDTDTQHYISQFSLPARTTNSFITVVNVDGGTSDTSGAVEVTLDIDMVLAMMPSIGQILVYTAPNSGSGVIDCYQKIADDNLATVVSTSWGLDETDAYSFSNASLEKPIFQKMLTQGQAIFAASGDAGAYDAGNNSLVVDDPASQTNVTGVGGTTLTTSSAQVYQSESTWNDTADTSRGPNGAGGGGGISQHVTLPDYQQGIVSNALAGEFSTSFRNVPDVSLNADPNTGYIVYFSAGEAQSGSPAGLYYGGGTSAAAPLWAAFWLQINQALTAQGKPVAGFANPLIYQFAKNSTSYANDFHDVNDNSTNLHYHAVNGYDTATGWGSFNGVNLFNEVVNYLGSALTAPAGVIATPGNAAASVKWNAVAGATTYNLYKGTSPGAETLFVSGITTTSRSFAGLTNGTTYYFTVAAVNAGGTGPKSTEVSATPAAPLTIAPTGVVATPGNAAASVKWNAVAGATSYNLYKGTSPGAETLFVSGITTTSRSFAGLTNGTTYYFKVAAVNTGGTGPQSTEVSATPAAPLTTAPTGVIATPGNAAASVKWNAVAGATSYNLYKGTSPGAETLFVSGITTTSRSFAGLTNGTTYYFTVAAVNAGGTGPQSTEVSATPAAALTTAPTGVVATPGNAAASVKWNAVAGATTYNLYKGTSPGAETLFVSGITTTNRAFAGLTNGTTYYFTVAAVNAGGVGPQSSEVSATPEAPLTAAPTGVVATRGNAVVGLQWNAVAGATSYNLYKSTRTEDETLFLSGITTTSYSVGNLTNGVTYYFRVAGVNFQGTGQWSDEVDTAPMAEPLTAPTGLTATSGDGMVSLHWNAVSGAGYNVFMNTSPGVGYVNVNEFLGFNDTSANITSLTNGTTYYFKVAAAYADGVGLQSTEISATPNAVCATPTASPIAAPTNLYTTPGSAAANLKWTPVACAASYNLYKGTSPGSEALYVSGITSTNRSFGNLTRGTTYYLKLAAVNSMGIGPQSIEVSVTPPVPPATAPSNVTATPLDSSAKVAWLGVADATSYNLYIGTSPGAETLFAANLNDIDNDRDFAGVNGTTYYITVAGVNAGGVGPQSSEISVTPTAPVRGPPTDGVSVKPN